MIDLRPFENLGRFDNDWLSARYHFSFANYHDPARQGFGPLLVWNDDMVQAGRGFDRHGHRDMEIVTYVRSGAITHEDHLGNRGRTEAGDVQVMSAGKGILHAEYNLEQHPSTLFQIWIRPAILGVQPRWEQRRFPRGERAGELVPLASGRQGHHDALRIHQDAAILGGTLAGGRSVSHPLGRNRRAYIVAATGEIEVNGVSLGARDGAAISGEDALTIRALTESEILLADLP